MFDVLVKSFFFNKQMGNPTPSHYILDTKGITTSIESV